MRKIDWVVCFGSKWESPSVYTEKHFIKKFYNENSSILWVNPIPVQKLSLKGVTKNKFIFIKILNRIKTHLKLVSRINSNFFLLNPIFLPNVENRKTRSLNLYLLKGQIRLLQIILKIKNFGVISSGIMNVPFLFPSKNYNFYLQISGDLYSDLRGISSSLKEQLEKDEKIIFENADIILAASKNIYNKIYLKINNKKKLFYFPHGVEFDHFNKRPENKLGYLKKPIAGYFGSLTEANDQQMFIALAEANFSVVLIGKITGDYSNCNHKNIHYLGAIPYDKLPSYANDFDIAIMAWKPADWISNCNPSKTLEYLALGKPIISNTIPELKTRFADFIYFADKPDDFIKMANIALAENNNELIELRKKTAIKEDWENKIKSIIVELGLES